MKHRQVLALAMAALLAGGAHAALAGDRDESRAREWKEHHPRRAEVNNRLNNQDRRINREVKEGDMSPAEAAKLHREDRHIRNEERNMAADDHGHISKREQRRLNRQENAVSRQIGK
jgi:hypothetical protein